VQVLQVELEVRPDPAEVGRARKWARSRLSGSGIDADEPIAETLVLIVSELVTNAVVHTGCPAVLRLLLRAAPAGARGAAGAARERAPRPGRAPEGPAALVVDSVRVEVADACARPPRPRSADGDATGGRGLALVDGLADRWGWEPAAGGKRIWCEVDRATAAAADPTRLFQEQAAYPDLAAYLAV
jgi:anti-sigma regulatory factor (Ser/Thr protein kinase)